MLTLATYKEAEDMDTIVAVIKRLDRVSRPLTAAGLGMLVVFVLTLIALAADPRTIGGAPAWLKPAKFAISTAIYALTLAWIFTYLPEWPRLTRIVGWVTAVVLVLEVAIIDLQAARGVTSHFNIATPMDAIFFAVMGIAILIAWAVAITLTVALFRQPFADAGIGWALRLGMLLTVIGSATGGLMTRPTDAQLASARAGSRITAAGAHTVGAPDGGPGLPGTGWSREHGDLRVPHFMGLHAIQMLPLVAWLIGPLGSIALRRRAVLAAAVSYGSLFAILLAQALAGEPLLAPQGLTQAALVIWLIATAAGLFVALSRRGKGMAMPALVSR
jgi:hypothetical protein